MDKFNVEEVLSKWALEIILRHIEEFEREVGAFNFGPCDKQELDIEFLWEGVVGNA